VIRPFAQPGHTGPNIKCLTNPTFFELIFSYIFSAENPFSVEFINEFLMKIPPERDSLWKKGTKNRLGYTAFRNVTA
jgi:hypothetical protein